MAVTKKSEKKLTEPNKEPTGLKLVFGDYTVTAVEARQYKVTGRHSRCFFPNLEIAAAYIQEDTVLNGEQITTLNGFIAANKKIHDEIALAFDGIPF